jgi:hypothetical protein
MYDDRQFPDRYDRYVGTETASDSGRVVRTYNATPTTTDLACRFNPKGGQWRNKEGGQTFDYDAELRVPATATLLPSKRGDVPDKVIVQRFQGAYVTRTFTVVAVYSAFGQHQRAFLKELMP